MWIAVFGEQHDQVFSLEGSMKEERQSWQISDTAALIFYI